jgi:hypothetical protein
VVPDSEWLDAPAYYQMTIATWAQYQHFRHLPGCDWQLHQDFAAA